MSAAARVTLTDLLDEDRLEQVPVDPDVCRQLLTQASNHLRTAASGIAGGDNEGAASNSPTTPTAKPASR